LKKVAGGLPADPAAAAVDLVDKIFTGDGPTAAAATGELLRRAGIPLGSGKGPIVALPDGLTIVNAQVGVALLPSLAQQARNGLQFDLAQVHAVLAYEGVPEAKLTAGQLVAMLAAWGKGSKDSPATQYAGAAERALAAHHGQVFAQGQLLPAKTLDALQRQPTSLNPDAYASAVAVTAPALDPVQLLLLVAHAGSRATTKTTVTHVPPKPAPGPSGSHSLAEGLALPSCSQLADFFNGDEGGRTSKAAIRTILQMQLKQAAIERYMGTAREKLEKELDKGFENFDKTEDVLSYLAFTAALRFDVSPSNRTTTHFLHHEDLHANDVQFQAHAYFKAIVPKEYAPCFALAGLGLPTNADIKGLEVHWSEPNGEVALEAAEGGPRWLQTLDEHGRSHILTTPRRESDPPKPGERQPVQTVYQQVKAALDKYWLEAHAADLLPLLFGPENIPAIIAGFLYTNIVNMIKEAGLPSRTLRFPVTYHGNNVYRILGSGWVYIPFAGKVGFGADLLSCDGPKGPWKGSISVSGAAAAILAKLGKDVGYQGPTSGTVTVPGKYPFTLNTKTDQPQTFPFNDKFGILVELDESAIEKDFTEKGPNGEAQRIHKIGVAAGVIGGEDLRALSGLVGHLLSAGLEIPVVADAGGDLSCPGASLEQDKFDD
jgi:hypothetical protein